MFKGFTPCNAGVRAKVKTVTESFRENCVPGVPGERQVSLRAKRSFRLAVVQLDWSGWVKEQVRK